MTTGSHAPGEVEPGPQARGRPFLVRAILWSFGGDAFSRAGVLALTFIAVRALDPIDFGRFVALYAIAGVAAGVWDAGVSTLLTRELASKSIPGRVLIARLVRLRAVTSPIWMLTLAAALLIVEGSPVRHRAVDALFAAASALIASHALAVGVLRARFRFRSAAATYACGRWIGAAVGLAAFQYEGGGTRLTILALAVLAGELGTLLLSSIAVATRGPAHAPLRADAAEAITVRAALPFAGNSLLSLVYNRLDTVILAALSTPVQLARYAPASRIQDALYVLPASIATVALPVIARESVQPDGRTYVERLVRRLVFWSLIVSMPTAVVIFVFTPQLIEAVLGPEYSGTVTSLRILVWFLPLGAATAPLLAALAATGHAVDSTKVFAAAFGVAITLHLALDWWWGATGAAVSSLLRDPGALVVAVFFCYRSGVLTRRRKLSQASPST